MISEGTFKCISGKDLLFENFRDVDNQYGSDSDADFGIIIPQTGVWDARGSFKFSYSDPYICETGRMFLSRADKPSEIVMMYVFAPTTTHFSAHSLN